MASGGILCVYRQIASGGTQETVYRVSWDDGVTWTAEGDFDSGTTDASVGQCPKELAPGHVMVIYATINTPGGTDADLYQRYVYDGSGYDLHGNIIGLVGGGAAFATPSIVLGTAAAAGAATTVIRSDGTIKAFNNVTPSTLAFGQSPVVGTSAYAAEADHEHGMPAAPSGATDHEHINSIQFNGDGATTAFELPAAPFDAYAVVALVAGVIVDVTLSGTMLTTCTFGVAPASGTNNVRVDIVAAAA